MDALWDINSGVLTGVMIAVYELILLPAVDWSLTKVTRLLNVRALTRNTFGALYESPLSFSGIPYICVRKRDSWFMYLLRLLPFGLVTTWGFLLDSEGVTRMHTTQATVMMPGDGAFRFSASEGSVSRSASLEMFCSVNKDIFLRTGTGDCTTKKVFSDLGTDPTVNEAFQDCNITLETINSEVGGVVGRVLGVGRCGEGQFFSFWTDTSESSQSFGQFFRIIDDRIFMAQIHSEMYMEIAETEGNKLKELKGILRGVYGSVKGIEVHFKDWDEEKFLRAIMTNTFTNGMGPLKQVTAALLVPRSNVTVEVVGETVILTRVSTAMMSVTIGLVVLVIVLCGIGLMSDSYRRRRYKLNPVSGALEVASLAVAGSNYGKIVNTRITVTRCDADGDEVVEQTMENAMIDKSVIE